MASFLDTPLSALPRSRRDEMKVGGRLLRACPVPHHAAPGITILPRALPYGPYHTAPGLTILPRALPYCPGPYHTAPGLTTLPRALPYCPVPYHTAPGLTILPRA